MRSIAADCECSRNTVSLALKNDPRVTVERGKKIREFAKAMGYRADAKVSQVMGNIARRETLQVSKIGVLVPADFKRPDPWKDHSFLKTSYDGISQQMEERGYQFDCFWLGAPQMTPSRMENILLTRGIEGLIVLSYAKSPAVVEFDFSNFSAAVIGRALTQPRLDAVGGDLNTDLNTAILKIKEQGYDRIGMALDDGFSARSMHRWETAYQYYQTYIPKSQRVPACIYSRSDTSLIAKWIQQFKPQCIIGLSSTTYQDLIGLGFSFPQDAGFVTLIQDDRYPRIAGIDLPHRLLATKAVDIVVEKLRLHKYGLPENPELILFAGRWVDGESLTRR